MSRTESSHPPEPIMTLNPPDTNAPKSSIYAITADPFGHAIASGSPERVVRMWDPRSGRRTAKLVGHTDNIRAILISEDSRYVSYGYNYPLDVGTQQTCSFSQGLPMVCTSVHMWSVLVCLTCLSINQTLVAGIAALPADVHLPCRFSLVAFLIPSLPRSFLFWRQNGTGLQGRRRRLLGLIRRRMYRHLPRSR
jgi:hypothetical protein